MKTQIISVGMLCALTVFAQEPETIKATAKLEPKSGSNVTGTVTFVQRRDLTEVLVDIENLKPGKHGFHIHEKGDCSAPDASSAGGHFNPTHQHHGGPSTAERHNGDLGNIEAPASGKVHWESEFKMNLKGPDSIIGKSVVVHEKEDDLKTDPAGNSGARIACGEIHASE